MMVMGHVSVYSLQMKIPQLLTWERWSLIGVVHARVCALCVFEEQYAAAILKLSLLIRVSAHIHI
jgi:hypothetical protein